MQVFISHSKETSRLAKELGAELRRQGWDVWNDEEILPGDNWAEKVGRGLKSSQAMVALLTPEAINSSWVLKEIEYALGEKSFNKRLIPVIVGSEESISPQELPWIFKHLKVIKLPAEGRQEDGIIQITQALRAVA